MSVKIPVVLLTTALGLFLVAVSWFPTTDPRHAAAQEMPPNPSDVCEASLEAFIEERILVRTGVQVDISHGACVALAATLNPTPLAASVCQNAAIREFFMVATPGECVGLVSGLLREIV